MERYKTLGITDYIKNIFVNYGNKLNFGVASAAILGTLWERAV